MPRAQRTTPLKPSDPTIPPRTENVVRVTLEIPTRLVEQYEMAGLDRDRTLEEELLNRLERCVTHTAITPLYVADKEKRELEEALGHNISHPGVLVAQLKSAVTLKVGEVEVELPPNLQQRIRSRVFRGEEYATVLKREVIKGLRRFSGLDPS